MPFLFATVILTLFFLGLSMGLSPTSIITADHSVVVDKSSFFLGKLNFLDLINLL